MEDTTAVESVEILELDERLDMASDPMPFSDTNTCCYNSSCHCPPTPRPL
jgi:hypothetical protein